ncbi:ESX secretion-associated protein EspG [Actinokineospora soli]|uniref:ESX secretion-associated protein EspG n=1 Tax=Actinokineospora soli TaxID=1048753 RepID=A0ABW2TLH4_9PSEU
MIAVDRIELDELDLLAEHAGAPVPFPLRAPAFGRTATERAERFAAAGRALAARGLADADGPLGAAADLVAALRGPGGAVDLVVVAPTGVTAVLALVDGDDALVCVQTLTDGHASAVGVRRVAAAALADALAAVVPDLPGAPALPITLPPGVVTEALRRIDREGDNDATAAGVRALIRDRGGDPEALDRLTGLLREVTARGQLGATTPTGARAAELSWLDSPSGRVRTDRNADGWTSVNPLRRTDFRHAVSAAAQLARAPR